MNYDALIKRVKNAIEEAKMKDNPTSVHKVTVDDDISTLSGLVVVLHPDFKSENKTPLPSKKIQI